MTCDESGLQVTVRPLRTDDLEPLAMLINQIPSDDDLARSACAQIRGEFENPHIDNARFVVCHDERVIGTMGCGPGPFPSPLALWADWLVVDAHYRNAGVASLLYTEVENHARKLGKTLVCLDIGNIDKERAAYNFHQRNGFQVVGQLPDYWSPTEHLTIMAKILTS